MIQAALPMVMNNLNLNLNAERALTISPVQVGAFNDLQADICPKHPTIAVDEVHSRSILPVADDNR